MSNVPVGRTYTHYEWVLKDDLTDWQRVYAKFPENYEQVATPFVVPNGRWVMERPYCGWTWLIGVEHGELEYIDFTNKHGARRVLYVSDKPFGYIVADEEDVDRDLRAVKPTGRKTLAYARQIHKGELGQGVPIQRLSYVRQALEPDESLSVRKRRKHGQRGWIRLTDLAAAAKLIPEDIVFGFWQFSGHHNYWFYHKEDQEGGQLLDFVVASSPDEIKHQCPEVLSTTQTEASRLVQQSVEDLWVRRGFAYTVLRLLALGIRPEVTQPV